MLRRVLEAAWKSIAQPFRTIRSCIALILVLCVTGCSPSHSEGRSLPVVDQVEITASAPVHLLELSGEEVDPFSFPDSKWLVFVFISVDCPISNRYAPEIRRLQAKF